MEITQSQLIQIIGWK